MRILDNILMAQELVKGYGRFIFLKCVIKIDLQKAFDCLNYNFALDELCTRSLSMEDW